MSQFIELIKYDGITQNILSYLDFTNTINLNIASANNIQDARIYWKSIEYNKIMTHDKFLLKDKFKYKYNNKLSKFYEYIKSNPHICIAGGYPTLMFLGKDLNDYKESDIDVYVMENSAYCETTKSLIHFLTENYKIEFQQINNCRSVFNCIINGCSRILQIISTQFATVNEIFHSFDMGYIKCGLYLGKTIVTYDAIYSKNINTTHIMFPNKNRIVKAHKKNMKVYGHDEIYDIQSDDKQLHIIDANELQIIPLKNFIISYQQMKNYFNYVELDDIDIIDIKQTYFKNTPYNKYQTMNLLMICQINSNYNTNYVNKMPIITKSIKLNICGKLYKNTYNNKFSIKIFDKNNQTVKKLHKIIIQLEKIIKLKKSDFNIKSNNCLKSDLHCKFRPRIRTRDIDMINTIFYSKGIEDDDMYDDSLKDDYEEVYEGEYEDDLYIKSMMDDNDNNNVSTGLYINSIKTDVNNLIINKAIADNENKMFELNMTFKFDHKTSKFHNGDNNINCIYVAYELVKISDIV